jgi:hypothetical protein
MAQRFPGRWDQLRSESALRPVDRRPGQDSAIHDASTKRTTKVVLITYVPTCYRRSAVVQA